MRSSSSIATSRSVRPDDAGFEHAPQRLVGELGGRADAGDLPGVLDRPQPLDGAGARDELPLRTEQLAQARVLLDGDARLVEAQAPAAASRLSRAAGGRLEQIARDDLAVEHLRDLLGRLGGVAKVGEEAVGRVQIAVHLRGSMPARWCR